MSAVPVGCGRKQGGMNPTTGQVFVGGRPAANATVIFYPQGVKDVKAYPAATVAPDGSFRVTTHKDGDGAPEGDYIVTIVWPEDKRPDAEKEDDRPDRLGGRFADPATSPLRASVKKGKNDLARFDLN
jgi:hypothetical protein